jgi:hypothetical protein
MALRHAIGDVTSISEGIWRGRLTPAEVRRVGEGKSSFGARSVVAVRRAHFDAQLGLLTVDPDATTVLNIGASDEVFLLDLGDVDLERELSSPSGAAPRSAAEIVASAGQGDTAFLAESERFLDAELVGMARRLLCLIRLRYTGDLHEGEARKWVNQPGNFMALTIQNRDQSLAIHVKGAPKRFDAPSLDVKSDRGSYSRFKLKTANQFDDALRVILASARASEGY